MANSIHRFLIAAILLVGVLPSGAHAEKRMALVIGNAAYEKSAHLQTPVNDAQDIATALKQLNFEVTLATDLNGAGLVDTMAAFARRLTGADVAVLYFTGHGLQFRGENYFLPIDAHLLNEFSVRREAFPIQDLIAQMDARAGVNLVFLDASRANPIAETLRSSLSSARSADNTPSLSSDVGRGLGVMPSLRGETLLVYAAAVGTESVAETGPNSPFARALLQHLSSPGVEIEVMLKRVTGTVRELTQGEQKPQRLSRLTKEFYFSQSLKTAQDEDQTGDNHTTAFPIPELVSLPGGVFLMGCVSGKNCQADEQPVHAVKLSPFMIAKFETTFEQWDACVADGGCNHRPADQAWGRGKRPVINVSWHDAQSYATWLSTKTGHTWRLPTEAEWEFAARAGTSTPFASGPTLTGADANFGFLLKRTTPVGQYPANPFGLHDMHGNVWEWVNDYYDENYFAASPTHDPAGPARGSARVFRGGSWMYNLQNLRSADRNNYAPEFRSKNVGFRLVRTP